jgi:hypothetical protein
MAETHVIKQFCIAQNEWFASYKEVEKEVEKENTMYMIND